MYDEFSVNKIIIALYKYIFGSSCIIDWHELDSIVKVKILPSRLTENHFKLNMF